MPVSKPRGASSNSRLILTTTSTLTCKCRSQCQRFATRWRAGEPGRGRVVDLGWTGAAASGPKGLRRVCWWLWAAVQPVAPGPAQTSFVEATVSVDCRWTPCEPTENRSSFQRSSAKDPIGKGNRSRWASPGCDDGALGLLSQPVSWWLRGRHPPCSPGFQFTINRSERHQLFMRDRQG